MLLKQKMGSFLRSGQKPRQDDYAEVSLPGLCIKLKRSLDTDIPHEVTIVVPRAEFRKKCDSNDCDRCEYEIIYSSITVVHAPRHPPTDSLREQDKQPKFKD